MIHFKQLFNMKHFILLLTLVSTSILGWAQQLQVNLDLTGFASDTPVYLFGNQGAIAQTYLKNNQAQLVAKVSSEPSFYNIIIADNGQYYQTPLFVADEQVTITGNLTDFPNALKVSGSQHHIYQTQINQINKEWLDKNEALNREYAQLVQAEPTPENEKRIQEISTLQKEYFGHIRANEQAFILKHFDTAFAQAIVSFHLSYGDKAFCQKVYDKLSKKEKTTELGRKFKLVAESPEMKKGSPFIDATYQDLSGATHQMRELFPSQTPYVLIEFSSVGCGNSKACINPSRKAVAQTNGRVTLYSLWEANKIEDVAPFKEITDPHTHYGFIQASSLTNDLWLQYGVSSTPSFFLFDKNGILIDRWSGTIEHQAKIKEYFE